MEDSDEFQTQLTSLVELESGSVLGVASSEEDAIAWLGQRKGQWDLAVVDLFLEQGSGVEVIRWCRARQPRQRVVVLIKLRA